MLPNLDKLYKPYAKDADLKTSILYWEREAANLSIAPEIRDTAIAETFLEMAGGKTFPIGSCDCGCEFPIVWSSVSINHYVLKRMIAMKDEVDIHKADIIKATIHAGMLAIIEAKNAEFVIEQTKQFDVFTWVKEKFNGLVRSSK